MNKFTVPEINLLCIYADESREQTAVNIITAIPDFEDKEMVELAEGIIEKLDKMSDGDFSDWDFAGQFAGSYEYE
ncbi:MAG: transposon-transfer assisting family protein [Oscillospiraceae bacterium]|jgi:hypothetical protein|nr:transposon-transfer assisting family protein [Oscillospiraceae bacterium]